MEGINEIFKNLDNVLDKAIKGAITGTALAGKHLQGKAKEKAPVAEKYGGQLRNSIQNKTKVSKNEIESVVFTNVEYASYLEFGTGRRGESSASPPKSPENISYRYDWAGMPAQPYMYPSMIQEKEKIEDIIASEIKREVGGKL